MQRREYIYFAFIKEIQAHYSNNSSLIYNNFLDSSTPKYNSPTTSYNWTNYGQVDDPKASPQKHFTSTNETLFMCMYMKQKSRTILM